MAASGKRKRIEQPDSDVNKQQALQDKQHETLQDELYTMLTKSACQ